MPLRRLGAWVRLAGIKNLWLQDRLRLSVKIEFPKETAAVPGVAGASLLFDFKQESIAVAVGKPANEPLRVAARLSLHPEFLTGTAPVVHQPGFQSLCDRFAAHPGHHQDPPGGPGFLYDRWDQSVGIIAKLEVHSVDLKQYRTAGGTARGLNT